MNAERTVNKNTPSEKRSEKYHELFKSIPKNEELQYSCSCLLCESSKYYQGRVYISTEHICFVSKSFFGKASIIIHLKNVIAIEMTTKILVQQCLNVITYDKTYSFRGISLKDDAYPIAMQLWQKAVGVGVSAKSIFQVDIARPAQMTEESAMVEEERVYSIPAREMIREIADEAKAVQFYATLTSEEIKIRVYMNRRTIEFANEYIDEEYRIEKNMLEIEHQSKGTLCRIYVVPCTRSTTKVKIVEKYDYTMQHYFAYIEYLIEGKRRSKPQYKWIVCAYVVMLVAKSVVAGIRAVVKRRW